VSESEATARQIAIDRFGEADRQYRLWKAPVNPHAEELAAATVAIQAIWENEPAEQGYLEDGLKYRLEVSKRQNERYLTCEARSKAFYKFQRLRTIERGKIVRFPVFTVFSVTLDAIKKHLGEPFLDSIAPAARTGRRTFRIVAKEAA
jgi:hypothetical protein